MSYKVLRPSTRLAPFVRFYWTMKNSAASYKKNVQRIIPNGLMELTFYIGDPSQVLDENKNISEKTFLSGQQKSFYDILVPQELSLFSVLFQPQGMLMFFGIPLNELYDQNVPLKFILKDRISELETKLYQTTTITEKVQIVESFLLNQLQENCKEHEYLRMSHCISRINHSGGCISINELASDACLSRKQFERTFLERIGTSPKQFLKTVRFQNALHQKQLDSAISLTQLAYACGYFDQSHMTNDFKSLTGLSPKNYFSDFLPFSDYYST